MCCIFEGWSRHPGLLDERSDSRVPSRSCSRVVDSISHSRAWLAHNNQKHSSIGLCSKRKLILNFCPKRAFEIRGFLEKMSDDSSQCRLLRLRIAFRLFFRSKECTDSDDRLAWKPRPLRSTVPSQSDRYSPNNQSTMFHLVEVSKILHCSLVSIYLLWSTLNLFWNK